MTKGYLSQTERIILYCNIETKEPLHVGSGRETAEIREIDQPIILDHHGNPIIPGSTIKGFLRNLISSILLAHKRYAKKISVPIGEIYVEISLDKIVEDFVSNPINIVLQGKAVEELGPIEHVFGSPNFAALIKITDAVVKKTIKPQYRTHVSIDPGTGRARKGALVSVEYVPKGTSFEFNIIYDKLEDELFQDANKLFLILAKILTDGYNDFIGGWKSRGYGLVEIKCTKIRRIKLNELETVKSPQEIDIVTLAKDWLRGAQG